MKTIKCLTILCCVSFLVTCAATMQENTAEEEAPAPPARFFRGPRIVSPELHADNSVTFNLNAPEATEVFLRGDWMAGSPGGIPLTTENDTIWTVTVGPLEPELWGYYFTIDGVRVLDPSNTQMKRDGTRIENILLVPGEASDLYQPHNVPHGTVAKVWYDSPTLGLQRRMYVYTPPGYEKSNQRYPVLYLLHGAGGDEDAWTTLGRANHILDNLIARGEAEPMIVVMTNGNANQPGTNGEVAPPPEDRPEATGSFPESLVNDVVPFIEASYRTLTTPDDRAVAGLSMGGGHTISITLGNPGTFKYIGLFSSLVRGIDSTFTQQLIALRDENPELYWIAIGEDDFLYEGNQELLALLEEIEIEYTYVETSGGHTWTNWRIYLSKIAPLLFR